MSYLTELILLIQQRILNASLAIPNRNDWVELGLLFLAYTAIALLLGFKWDFLQVKILTSWQIAFRVIITSLFMPAIVEELFFRVVLIPHPLEQVSTTNLSIWLVTSLSLFVVSHPLNAMSFTPRGKDVFFKPIFLILACLLGVFCTILYCHSGSLWTAVFFHWIIVSFWLILLGGFEQLKFHIVKP